MEKRSYDTPMDFEYDNKRAQVPINSPWLGGTRTWNQTFGDPNKSKMAFQANNIPNTLPQTPIKNHVASFRDNPALDFSSGAENPSSPENADNEDTPEVKNGVNPLNDNVTVFRGTSPAKGAPPSPTKSTSRSSISNFFALPARFSPSHKSLVRKDQSRHVSRPHKRKRKDLDREVQIRRGSSEPDYDSELQGPQQSSPRKGSHHAQPLQELGTIPAILKFIDDHPRLPHILSWWAQMLLSFFIVLGFMYILYSFWSAIRRDVDLKADELSRDLLSEISQCTDDFVNHGCQYREKLGANFRSMCDRWETCMKQDHRAIGRARISASTWADILNGFVEPLSGKIITLGVLLFTIAIFAPYALFGFIRRKEADFMPPPQPQRSMSASSLHQDQELSNNPFRANEQFFTPSHSRSYDAFGADAPTTGRRSPSKELRGDGMGSPVRRIAFR